MTNRGETIELPGGGRVELRRAGASPVEGPGKEPDDGLNVRPNETLVVSLPGVPERHFARHPLLVDKGPLRWAVHPRGDRVLLARVRGDRLHLLRLPEATLEPIALGERLPNVEQLDLVTSGELFVAISESGVYALDAEGRERWRIPGTTYDWRYVGDEDGDVWLSDTNGNLLGFDAQSGRERSS